MKMMPYTMRTMVKHYYDQYGIVKHPEHVCCFMCKIVIPKQTTFDSYKKQIEDRYDLGTSQHCLLLLRKIIWPILMSCDSLCPVHVFQIICGCS